MIIEGERVVSIWLDCQVPEIMNIPSSDCSVFDAFCLCRGSRRIWSDRITFSWCVRSVVP